MARTTRRAPPKKEPGSGRDQAPTGRPVWSGQLRLALVSVPVKVFAATRSGARLSFHQIHKPSGQRVHYEKVVAGIGPVDTDEIIKGFEFSKGRYVLLTDADIDKVRIDARKTIDLVQFVDHCEIDPIYYERPYYVLPDDELAEDAYRVLRDALRKTAKVGLGQMVMRGQEYIVALKPCGDGMMLETLRYSDEVRDAAPLFADVGTEKSEAELLDLAQELIGRKARPFDPERFHDHYTEALRDMIEAKVKTGKAVGVDEEDKPARGGAKVIDLVEALRASVRGKPAEAAKAPARRARKAPAAGRKAG